MTLITGQMPVALHSVRFSGKRPDAEASTTKPSPLSKAHKTRSRLISVATLSFMLGFPAAIAGTVMQGVRLLLSADLAEEKILQEQDAYRDFTERLARAGVIADADRQALTREEFYRLLDYAEDRMTEVWQRGNAAQWPSASLYSDLVASVATPEAVATADRLAQAALEADTPEAFRSVFESSLRELLSSHLPPEAYARLNEKSDFFYAEIRKAEARSESIQEAGRYAQRTGLALLLLGGLIAAAGLADAFRTIRKGQQAE